MKFLFRVKQNCLDLGTVCTLLTSCDPNSPCFLVKDSPLPDGFPDDPSKRVLIHAHSLHPEIIPRIFTRFHFVHLCEVIPHETFLRLEIRQVLLEARVAPSAGLPDVDMSAWLGLVASCLVCKHQLEVTTLAKDGVVAVALIALLTTSLVSM